MALELLHELIDFGWDYLTVWILPSLEVPIVLMVIFGYVELLELAYLRHDGIRV